MKRTTLAALFLSLIAVRAALSTTANEYPDDQKVLFVRGELEIHPSTGEGKRKVTEHKDQWGVKRYRIPHITLTPDGDLVIAVVGRCSVGGDHGKSTTFFARSGDKGETWEIIRHSTDYARLDKRPDEDFPLTERTQETQVVWYPAMECYVATFLTKNAAWFTTSTDLKKWTPATQARFDGDDKLKFWPSPASLQLDPDGSLLLAITGTETLDSGTQRFARLLWTRDLKSFESSPSMPCLGNETAVAPLGEGHYFVTTRISPKRLNLRYNRRQRSWSKPVPFPQPAHWRCEVDVINDDGRLFLTTPTKGRTRGTLYMSKNQGTSWEKVALLTEGDFAYSSLVMIDKDTIGIVSEREDQDIVFQTFKVPD